MIASRPMRCGDSATDYRVSTLTYTAYNAQVRNVASKKCYTDDGRTMPQWYKKCRNSTNYRAPFTKVVCPQKVVLRTGFQRGYDNSLYLWIPAGTLNLVGVPPTYWINFVKLSANFAEFGNVNESSFDPYFDCVRGFIAGYTNCINTSRVEFFYAQGGGEEDSQSFKQSSGNYSQQIFKGRIMVPPTPPAKQVNPRKTVCASFAQIVDAVAACKNDCTIQINATEVFFEHAIEVQQRLEFVGLLQENGTAYPVLNALSQCRFFNIAHSGNVSFSHLEFWYGYPGVNQNGGALRVDAGTISSIEDCTFFSNTIANIASGGAISVERKGLVQSIVHTSFTGNRLKGLLNVSNQCPKKRGTDYRALEYRTSGGAMYVSDATVALISMSNFTSNEVITCSQRGGPYVANANGGAIGVWFGGRISLIENCVFVSNSAKHFGGAIRVGNASATIKNISGTTFSKNWANYHGGAIASQGDMIIDGSVFEDNDPKFNNYRGGAVWFIGFHTQTRIFNSNFTGNGHPELLSGGAVYISDEQYTICPNNTEGVRTAKIAIVSSRFKENMAFTGSAVTIRASTPKQVLVFQNNFEGDESTAIPFALGCSDLSLDYLREFGISGAESLMCRSPLTKCIKISQGAIECACVDQEKMEHHNESSCYVKPNFYRLGANSTELFACPVEGACIGGMGAGDSLCADAYKGQLCRTCKSNYSTFYFTPGKTGFIDSNGVCTVCPDYGTLCIMLLLCFLVGLAGYIWLLRRTLADNKELAKKSRSKSEMEKVSPIEVAMHSITHAQVIGLAFEVPFSGDTSASTNGAPVSTKGFGILCALRSWERFPSPHIAYGAFLLCLPIAVVISLAGFASVRRLWQPGNWRHCKDFIFAGFYIFYFLVYVSLVSNGFKILTCIDSIPGTQSTLFADSSVFCNDDSYRKHRWIGLALVIVYGFIVPIMLAFWMRLQFGSIRDKMFTQNLKKHVEYIGNIYKPYKQEFWYWEFIMLLRKFFFSGSAVVFKMFGTEAQFLTGVIVLYIAACMQVKFRPFRCRALNTLDTVSVCASYGTLSACSIIMYMKHRLYDWKRFLIAFAALLNIIYIGYAFMLLYMERERLYEGVSAKLRKLKTLVTSFSSGNSGERRTRTSSLELSQNKPGSRRSFQARSSIDLPEN